MKMQQKIDLYYKNPKICEVCGNIIEYDGIKSLDKAYKRKYCGKECSDKSKERENSKRNRKRGTFAGIYCIKNKVNGKLYIGQSVDYLERKRHHFYSLRNQRCYNEYLQLDWDLYGENNFEFIILKRCEIDELDKYEQKYISLYKSYERDKGYNIELGGVKDVVHSDEWRKRMANGVKNKTIEAFPNAKAVICLNTMEIFDSIAKASRKYNIGEDGIQHCCNPKYKQCTAGKLNGVPLQWDYYIEGKEYVYIPFVKKSRAKPIKCLNNGKIYNTKEDASEDTGCSVYGIKNCCENYIKTTGSGFRFQYA